MCSYRPPPPASALPPPPEIELERQEDSAEQLHSDDEFDVDFIEDASKKVKEKRIKILKISEIECQEDDGEDDTISEKEKKGFRCPKCGKVYVHRKTLAKHCQEKHGNTLEEQVVKNAKKNVTHKPLPEDMVVSKMIESRKPVGLPNLQNVFSNIKMVQLVKKTRTKPIFRTPYPKNLKKVGRDGETRSEKEVIDESNEADLEGLEDGEVMEDINKRKQPEDLAGEGPPSPGKMKKVGGRGGSRRATEAGEPAEVGRETSKSEIEEEMFVPSRFKMSLTNQYRYTINTFLERRSVYVIR